MQDLKSGFDPVLRTAFCVTDYTAFGRLCKIPTRSQRLFLAESQVFNSDGKEIARGSGTFMPSNIPLTPELGYR